jgi:hypothetical protein
MAERRRVMWKCVFGSVVVVVPEGGGGGEEEVTVVTVRLWAVRLLAHRHVSQEFVSYVQRKDGWSKV